MKPAHAVIEEFLRGLVDAASPGDRMPGDRELGQRFEVSRMTARQAVNALVAEGRIFRVPGSGTYVADTPVHRRATRLLSFAEHMRRQGRTPSAVVLAAEVRDGTGEENRGLAQATVQQVGHLIRVLKGDEIPIAIEEAVLSHDCRPVLDGDLTGRDLFDALAAIGREPVRAKGTATAEAATSSIATALDVPVGAPLIVQRQVIVDRHDRPVHLALTRYVGDRFILDLDQEKHVYSDPANRDQDSSYEVPGLPRRTTA